MVGVLFARNCGQTAATAAGIHLARGRLIATLDADLQNDPIDLPAMILQMPGHDAVVGYRLQRRDDFVRRVSSRVANRIRNWITQDRIRDTGCSLKVFRAQAIQALPLFEGMHRFLPTLLRYHGFSVLEHPVSHHPRTAGRSKYGVRNRALRAFVVRTDDVDDVFLAAERHRGGELACEFALRALHLDDVVIAQRDGDAGRDGDGLTAYARHAASSPTTRSR